MSSQQSLIDQEINLIFDTVRTWRRQIVRRVFYVLATLGFLVMIAGSYSSYTRGDQWAVPIYVGAYALLVVVAFWRRVPYGVQVGTLLSLLYGVSVLSFADSGLDGDGKLFLLALAALAMLLLGWQWGSAVLSVCVMTMVVMGGLFASALLAVPVEELVSTNTEWSSWISTALVFLMLGALLALSQNHLFHRLLAALTESRQLTSRLKAEIAERQRAGEELARQEAELRATLYSIGDAVIAADIEGRVVRVNPVAERLTGWAEAEAAGQPLDEVFRIVDEDTHRLAENPVTRVLREGLAVGLANHTLLTTKDGREIPIADSAAPILDQQGKITGIVLVFRDQTEERLTQRMVAMRLSLVAYAADHTLEELLTHALDEVGAFVDSPIGFYHFLGPDQKTLLLQQWSTRTLQEFCRAEGRGMHYDIDQAGVWVDCVREKKPVIHNDYASLPHKKGMPEGHAEVIRELVVPVMRGNEVVAILGVGNKPTAYTQKDVEIVSYLADVTWEIVRQKRAEEALRESEEKFRSLFNQSVEGIYLHDLEGRIVDINETACSQSGYSREELLQLSVFDFHPDKADTINLPKAEILRQWHQWRPGQRFLVEAEHQRKDGTVFPVEIATGIIHYGGDRELMLAIVKDITERKQAEEERERLNAQVREQARKLQQILTTVPEGMLLLDAEGRILQVNPTAERDLAALAGAHVGDALTHLGDRPLSELLTSPPTRGLWHEIQAHGRTFEAIARPVENGPQPEHWVLVINDVTQEREIRAQLQQQERLAAVGQLAAGIAHDFNNILASIMLYAQMVARSEELSERDRERMTVVIQQAWHASRLTAQILDFSRRAVLERLPLDLLPLLKEQAKLLERTLPEHIRIELAYGQDEYVVDADPTRMQQMLTNLAVNARDAMPQGGTLRIGLERVTVERGESPLPMEMEAGEWIRLTVSDTGMGIPPNVLPHIFEPFFTTKGPGEGSGLGLAQVHGIVGQHGGHIGLETRAGEGTTFTIYLPALGVRLAKSSLSEVPATLQGQGELVLVVEDGDAVREALAESLGQLNYRTLEAADGEQALAVMEAQGAQVALVLSDVVMPGMGGIALLHALRERGWQTPVVLLTGHPIDDDLEALRAQGLSAWLTKPPSLDQLAQAVADALNAPPRQA